MSKVTVTFKREIADDDSPDLSYLEQDCFNDTDAKEGFARKEAYYKGDWHMIGIRAVATLWIERDGYRTNYEISSPGLWGIESDSDPAYLESVFRDECEILKADIEALKDAQFKLPAPYLLKETET